jgi:hypothetical protein
MEKRVKLPDGIILENEELPKWVRKRLEDLYLALSENPAYRERSRLTQILLEQKKILREPKLPSELNKVWTIYSHLRLRKNNSPKEIKEIFECEDEDRLKEYVSSLGYLVKSSEELKKIIHDSLEVVKKITGYSERGELMEELLRQLEEYGKAYYWSKRLT